MSLGEDHCLLCKTPGEPCSLIKHYDYEHALQVIEDIKTLCKTPTTDEYGPAVFVDDILAIIKRGERPR